MDDDPNCKSIEIDVKTSMAILTKFSKSIKIINAITSSTVMFTTKDLIAVGIDDVEVTKLGEITLNEAIDNDGAIESNNNNKTITVNTRRTLRAGIWNTMCLPFDVNMSTMEAALGEDQNIQMRTYCDYENNVMKFEEATEVSAGTPFLVKINSEKENPTFSGVTISNTPAQIINNNGVKFVGTYSPVDLATDGTDLFITISNTLARPKTDTGANHMNGLRAYIQVPSPTFASTRLALGDETTGIGDARWVNGEGAEGASLLNAEKVNGEEAFNLAGQRIGKRTKGLCIINGKLMFNK